MHSDKWQCPSNLFVNDNDAYSMYKIRTKWENSYNCYNGRLDRSHIDFYYHRCQYGFGILIQLSKFKNNLLALYKNTNHIQ